MEFEELLNELYELSANLLDKGQHDEGKRLYELWRELSKNGIYN